LELGEPLTTEQTVATTWQVALDRVGATPAALDLLSLCAFLAPDNVPRALLGEQAEVLPEPLRSIVRRPLAYTEAISTLGRYSLVTVTTDTLAVHRLVQTVVRVRLSPEAERASSAAAIRLLSAGFPSESHKVAV